MAPDTLPVADEFSQHFPAGTIVTIAPKAEVEDTPDPRPLQTETVPPPVLLLDAHFDKPVLEWMRTTAEATNAPLDYIFLPLLVSAAGCIGNTRIISPWSGWTEPCVLWGAIEGHPSDGKTPPLKVFSRALSALESDDLPAYEEQLRRHAAVKEAASLAEKAWKDEVQQAFKKNAPPPYKPKNAIVPDEPTRPRTMVNDPTVEGLAVLLQNNPRGLTLCVDELSGFIGNFDRYAGSKGGDRAFYLETYGAGSRIIDRKGSPSVRIPRAALSILGGIQPDKLRELLLQGDDDGFAARFLYVFPNRRVPDMPNCTSDEQVLLKALRRLRGLDFDTSAGENAPCIVTLTDEATFIFNDWRQRHYKASRLIQGKLASLYGKSPGVVLRLALVIAYINWAFTDEADAPMSIGMAGIVSAVDLMDNYFLLMAERAFGAASLSPKDLNVTKIAKWMLRTKPTALNVRELSRELTILSPRDRKSEAIQELLDEFVQLKWIFPHPSRQGDSPGRSRKDFLINNKIYELIVP